MIRLLHGNCMDRISKMSEGSFHALICDPPYYLTAVSRGGSARKSGNGAFGRHTIGTDTRGFMGRTWDGDGLAHTTEFWLQVYRVLKPGGVVKAFGGSRTFHNMAYAMEQVGFEKIGIEAWAYGNGFPKSQNVSKALDKMQGAKREPKRIEFTGNALMRHGGDNTRPWMEEALAKGYHELPGDEPATAEAKAWNGWGTALKPAWEPVLVGHKPK